jgi:enoyl-CoA hydratase/carnithine racemase
MDNEQQQGGVVIPTRAEILAELRAAQIDLDCTVDEARAVMALELVHRVKDDSEKLRDEIKSLINQIANDRRAKIAEAWILSRHNADSSANAEFQATLDQMGVPRRK